MIKKNKYIIKTYGCQMNKSDTERVAALLENIGYRPAKNIKKADLVIFNTCSVRQSAEDRVYGALKNLNKEKLSNPNLITAVTGCIASKDAEKLKGKVDIIFDIKNLFTLPQVLKKYSQGNKKNINIKGDLYETYDYLKLSPQYQSKFHAYVPIMTGCNNFCSYCVVPYARGREYSRSCKDIVEEIEQLIKKGYRAITLLGQNVNSYIDKLPNGRQIKFPDLLKKINDISGDFWIWFITSHPKDISSELISTIASSKKVGNYIHLPVQAGSDKILKLMNRKYNKKHYISLINKIRSEISDAVISTDTIVGFPGENKSDFLETVNLYKKIKFDMAYIAQYSERPGTKAAALDDNVSCEEKKRRENILTDILKESTIANNKKLIDKIEIVLAEKYSKGYLIGKTKTFRTIRFKGRKGLVGKFVDVKILKALDWGLEGKIK